MPNTIDGNEGATRDTKTTTQSIKDMRVFISYAHEDHETALKIRDHLDKLGVHVLWDRNFALGSGFHEQIKAQIAYAHVFIPVVTPSSSARGWVHQEIGYAMAMNVPVLPVALGQRPGEMIGMLHVVLLRDDGDIERLNEDALSLLVDQHDDPTHALHVCAEESEDRAELFYRYANEVRRLIGERHAMVFQSSALSSFHIPAETPQHQVWTDRYNVNDRRGLHHRRLQRRERLALQWHANRSGARLIICPEAMTHPGADVEPLAVLTRFRTLVNFLNEVSHDVELRHGALRPHGENITIVGHWFMATSLIGSRAQGYRHTTFTRHAPTIAKQIELFNREFEDTERFPGSGNSRQNAIDFLSREIDRLCKKVSK